MSNRLKKLYKRQELMRAGAGKDGKLVHGYMIYRCRKCGREWRMYLEKGIEEGGADHKPTPFLIQCKCKGIAQDVSGIVKLSRYMPLDPSMSYFANKAISDCGVPVVR